MRIVRSEPEAERFVLRCLLVELRKARDLVARGIACATSGCEIARSPPFARESNGVTRGFDEIGIHGKFRREEAPEIAAFLELMYRAAGEQRRP